MLKFHQESIEDRNKNLIILWKEKKKVLFFSVSGLGRVWKQGLAQFPLYFSKQLKQFICKYYATFLLMLRNIFQSTPTFSLSINSISLSQIQELGYS